MKKIAVTGGIAEGKSTVLAMFAGAGFSIGSADKVAREVRERPGIQAAIAELTGLDEPISTAELRELLGRSDDIRRSINALMHESILDEILESEICMWEVPLLIETALQNKFSQVIVVTCGERIQRERLVSRLGHEADIEAILATQLPTMAKLPFADFVIRTDCETGHVHKQVVELSHSLRGC